jgi:hypothetical protein
MVYHGRHSSLGVRGAFSIGQCANPPHRPRGTRVDRHDVFTFVRKAGTPTYHCHWLHNYKCTSQPRKVLAALDINCGFESHFERPLSFHERASCCHILGCLQTSLARSAQDGPTSRPQSQVPLSTLSRLMQPSSKKVLRSIVQAVATP